MCVCTVTKTRCLTYQSHCTTASFRLIQTCTHTHSRSVNRTQVCSIYQTLRRSITLRLTRMMTGTHGSQRYSSIQLSKGRLLHHHQRQLHHQQRQHHRQHHRHRRHRVVAVTRNRCLSHRRRRSRVRTKRRARRRPEIITHRCHRLLKRVRHRRRQQNLLLLLLLLLLLRHRSRQTRHLHHQHRHLIQRRSPSRINFFVESLETINYSRSTVQMNSILIKAVYLLRFKAQHDCPSKDDPVMSPVSCFCPSAAPVLVSGAGHWRHTILLSLFRFTVECLVDLVREALCLPHFLPRYGCAVTNH